MDCCIIHSPLGYIEIKGSKNGITSISFVADSKISDSIPIELQNCVNQLHEYFKGIRTIFDIKIEPIGTDFQVKVWQTVSQIPYGETTSYKQIAIKNNTPNAARAVGNANRNNKIIIVIPCHRVIAATGEIGGYNGGIDKKQWLLRHEKSIKQQFPNLVLR